MTAAHHHDVFQALADPTRRSFLKLLADKEMSIAAITNEYPITRTAVNKHLQVLSEAGLVTKGKIGREMRYKLKPAPLLEVKDWLAFFEIYWDEQLDKLQQFVEADDE
ncbi:metalloregulator ArsR/SmtB family transcription factor [Halobacillus rhizosphaerae]|uniref:ArsR/SmtB family transcription factor n=1 Tax=Halobacillus rhizosphaerae TaxID=3064889 RepID=UPI00398B5E73